MYDSDLGGNVAAGNGHGPAYLHRIALVGDIDLDRLVSWPAAMAHVSVHLINGSGLSGRLGTLLPVSGIEARPAARLFTLWIEQRLSAGTTLRVGQFTAAQEFVVSPTAALFINSTFGWPDSFATDLPSGGPAYPLAAPGLRLAAAPSPRVTMKIAVFAGDPAGPGTGDPQRRDLHGFNGLRLAGRPFLIAEVGRNSGGADPAWTIALGGWLHTGQFDDLARDDHGKLLPAAGPPGTPWKHSRDSAIYAMVDAHLWRLGARKLRGFVRASASSDDRNPIDRYLDAGLSLSSPLRARPNDIFGIALAIARISPRLRTLRTAQAEATGAALAVPRVEAVAEVSWQLSLSPHVSLQPDVHLLLHPAAALLAGPIMGQPSPHALVLALRTSIHL